jgi:5,10-methylenetetrahydromethanopterin reductase
LAWLEYGVQPVELEFGFSVTPGPPQGVAAEAAEAERLGFDRIGIWDSPALFREPWVTLAVTAAATRRIRIGTWVTNPRTRHPLVTASAAASLDDVAPGRVYLGIGSGDTGVSHAGQRASLLEELERYVAAVRGLLEDGRAIFAERTSRLSWARRSIPVIMAAHGPRALRAAGRFADGVVVGLGVTPEVVAGSLELLDAGAKEAGRRVDDLEVWFTCFWFVDPEPGRAKAESAWAATSFAAHVARTGVEGKLIPPEHRAGIVELGRRYDKVTHGAVPPEQKAAYTRLAEELGVAEYLQDRFVFAGTPPEVETQVRRAASGGARRFDGAIDADLPEHQERITKWAQHVLPGLRA